LLWPLVSGVQMVGITPDGQLTFGMQLLAVTQISVGDVKLSVNEFKHGCGVTSVGFPFT
jgi:hypothetical protein